MRRAIRTGSGLALAFALGAGCGGNTEQQSGEIDGGEMGRGGAAGAGASAGSGARSGGAGRAGESGGSGVGGNGPATGGTTGSGGSGGSTFGSGGSAGEADAGTDDDICSLPPDPGVCLAIIRRFLYDPARASCREFQYGGCGGNLNNFMTLADCEAKCAHRADSCQLCGTDSCSEHQDCRACPVNGEASGQRCATPGLQCNYGHCGPICTCREGAAGFAWQCIVLPC